LIKDIKEIGINEIRVGDELFFGTYPQWLDKSVGVGFTVGDIVWQVLGVDKDTGAVLIITKYALSAKQYNEGAAQNLPTWLRDKFVKLLLYPTERSRLCQNATAGEGEKFFLLSEEEAITYLATARDRIVSPTDYAKELCDGETQGGWWLRSTDSASGLAAYVDENGEIRKGQKTDTRFVRVAAWVTI